MGATHRFLISNVSIPVDEFEITKYIKLQKVNEYKTRLVAHVDDDIEKLDPYEINIIVVYRAIQLCLPDIQILLESDSGFEDDYTFDILRQSGRSLINFYGTKGNEIKVARNQKVLNEHELSEIVKIHKNILVPFHRAQRESRDNDKWNVNRWNYAYQQYIQTFNSITVDESVLKIITGLESLLVRGEGLLKYKVSLFASIILEETPEKRKETFDLIGSMYNLRSKVVHGEIKTVMKILSKPDIFQKHFALKNILSKLLIVTYSWNEEELFERLDEIVFQVPKF
ncbi:hypothetical protein ACRTEV_21490 [Rossellomorea arthrocnemi]